MLKNLLKKMKSIMIDTYTFTLVQVYFYAILSLHCPHATTNLYIFQSKTAMLKKNQFEAMVIKALVISCKYESG